MTRNKILNADWDAIVDQCIRVKPARQDCKKAVKAAVQDSTQHAARMDPYGMRYVFTNFLFWQCKGWGIKSVLLLHLIVFAIAFGIIFGGLVAFSNIPQVIRVACAFLGAYLVIVIFHIIWAVNVRSQVMDPSCISKKIHLGRDYVWGEIDKKKLTHVIAPK